MSFLKRFFGERDKEEKGQEKGHHFTRIGNTDNKCPYCENTLTERPHRKKKCPHCKNDIYVCTRPIDKEKVLVTEEQFQEIERQWEIYHYEQSASPEEKQEFENTRRAFLEKSEREPSRNDIFWSMYNKKLLEYAQNGDWGLYRNTRHKMAELLSKEGKEAEALKTFCEIAYLDINGIVNTNKVNKLAFNPAFAMLVPGVVYSITTLAERLKLGQEGIREIFYEVADRIYHGMKAPIQPTEAWKILLDQLDPNSSKKGK